MKRNVISWFDIPADDFERAVNFYSEILGEEIRIEELSGQKLGFFSMDENSIGGDIAQSNNDFKPSPFGTRVYLNCNGKIDEVISRVKKAGGAIIREKFMIDDWGETAIIMDTEGNTIGLHNSKK